MQALVQGPLQNTPQWARHRNLSLPPSTGIKDSSLVPPLGVILPLVPEVIGMGKDHWGQHREPLFSTSGLITGGLLCSLLHSPLQQPGLGKLFLIRGKKNCSSQTFSVKARVSTNWHELIKSYLGRRFLTSFKLYPSTDQSAQCFSPWILP